MPTETEWQHLQSKVHDLSNEVTELANIVLGRKSPESLTTAAATAATATQGSDAAPAPTSGENLPPTAPQTGETAPNT